MEAQIAGPNISERGNTIVVVPNPLRSLFGSLVDLGSSKLRETVCDPHSLLPTIRSAIFRLRVPPVHIFNQRRQHFGRNLPSSYPFLRSLTSSCTSRGRSTGEFRCASREPDRDTRSAFISYRICWCTGLQYDNWYDSINLRLPSLKLTLCCK